jgi:hypothetical protein
MKYVAAVFVALAIGVPAWWVQKHFTLVQFGDNWAALRNPALTVLEVPSKDEWVIAKDVQAAECATGGGCAIFSQRELMMALQQFLLRRGKDL